MTMTKLGQLLVDKGLISEDQCSKALKEQQSAHRFLGSILIERGWVEPQPLLDALAEQYHIPAVRLREIAIDRAVVEHIPLKVALHYTVMPIRLEDSTLTVAIANPQDVRRLDEMRLNLEQRYMIDSVLATEADILHAVKKYYGVGAETIQQLVAAPDGAVPLADTEEAAVEDIEQLAKDASVVKLVNQLVLEAHTRHASDIHLEPYRGKVRLRYRIDGMLHRVDVPPAIRRLFPAIVSRVKVLSNLNLVERRLPQDGRASVKIGKEKLDLRIAVLPTPAGESVVIRILPNQMLLELRDLGFRQDDLKVLEQVIRKPHGLALLTGPTGSGKTTTLYTCLKTINSEERKIITIEDPIEYELEGLTQVQVAPQIGFTFAEALRNLLRHDPNVMMVGEIRDRETAELAIRIALTGHLIFSTLHTNDATGAMIRLMDMEIDPYLVASSVECVIAQRLVRLLCSTCKEEVAAKVPGMKKVFQSRGCDACQRTGYRGRMVIYELFLMAPSIMELILQKASADAIRRKAIELGMVPMRQDGLNKVKAGLTTLDEILRVTQDESEDRQRIHDEP